MAIYHLSAQILGRGKRTPLDADGNALPSVASPRTSVAAAAYRAGAALRGLDGTLYDYSRKRGVVHAEILLPANASEIYRDRQTLWRAVDEAERRKDSQLAREFDIALPRELTQAQNIALAREYLQANFVDLGMCADWCYHNPGKGEPNPHIHVMLTMRLFDEQGHFGNKGRDWNKKSIFMSWREQWAERCNAHLAAAGFDERIDHRSYKEQGIDREPTVHLGPQATALERKGILTVPGDINRIIEETRPADPLEQTMTSIHQRLQQARVRNRAAGRDGRVSRLSARVLAEERNRAKASVRPGPARNVGGGSIPKGRTYTSLRDVCGRGDPLHPNLPSEGKKSVLQRLEDARNALTPAGPMGPVGRRHVRMAFRASRGQPSTLRLELHTRITVTATVRCRRLSQRERLESIRRVAATLRFLGENGVERYSQLEEKLATLEGRLSNAQLAVDRFDAEIKQLTALAGWVKTCQTHRPLAEQYASKVFGKAGFYQKHQREFDAFLEARRQLKAAGLNENTPPDTLLAKREQLAPSRADAVSELRQLKDELTRWRIARADVRELLEGPEQTRRVDKQRGKTTGRVAGRGWVPVVL